MTPSEGGASDEKSAVPRFLQKPEAVPHRMHITAILHPARRPMHVRGPSAPLSFCRGRASSRKGAFSRARGGGRRGRRPDRKTGRQERWRRERASPHSREQTSPVRERGRRLAVRRLHCRAVL